VACPRLRRRGSPCPGMRGRRSPWPTLRRLCSPCPCACRRRSAGPDQRRREQPSPAADAPSPSADISVITVVYKTIGDAPSSRPLTSAPVTGVSEAMCRHPLGDSRDLFVAPFLFLRDLVEGEHVQTCDAVLADPEEGSQALQQPSGAIVPGEGQVSRPAAVTG